jgi:hypothetical protein
MEEVYDELLIEEVVSARQTKRMHFGTKNRAG